jgi:hypothetical protein
MYVRSSPDSCFLLASDSCTVPTVVPTSEIKTIEYADHWSGLVGGLIAGAGLGLLLGGAAFSLSWSGTSPALAYLALLASLASFIGLPIYGGVDGIPNTIVFPSPAPKPTGHELTAPDVGQRRYTQHDTAIRAVSDSLEPVRTDDGGRSPR